MRGMDLAGDPTEENGAKAAFAAAAAGVLGLAAVGVWLRGGLPFEGVDLSLRASYILRHKYCWTAGWLLAGVGAVLVVNLFFVLASRWQTRGRGKCRLAMILATAGLGADLSGLGLWIVVAPGLDAAGLGLVERIAGALSLFVAKILYSSAGVFLVLSGRKELSPSLLWLSFGVWLSGFWVAAATLCECRPAQLWGLGTLVILFVVWSALLGFHFLGIPRSAKATAGPSFTPDPRD